MSNIISFDLALARKISEGKEPGKILTRDGYSVKIIYWNAIGSFPLVGLVNYGSYERAEHYTVEGLSNFGRRRKSEYDLIIVQG